MIEWVKSYGSDQSIRYFKLGMKYSRFFFNVICWFNSNVKDSARK